MNKKPVLWIFGGSSKLGKLIVENLIVKYRVIRFSRSGSTSGLNDCVSIELDLSNIDKMRSVIDSLLNSEPPRAIIFCQRYRPYPDDVYDSALALNTEIFSTQAIIEAVMKRGSETRISIAIVSSLNAFLTNPNIPFEYHLLKVAQIQLIKYYSTISNPSKININGVAVGSFLKDNIKSYPEPFKKWMEKLKKRTPTMENTHSIDLVRCINFLISDDARQVNGQVLKLDGGLTNTFQEVFI